MLVLVTSLLISSQTFADETPDQLLRRGAALIRGNDWKEAETLLLKASGEQSKDPDIRALLGIARYHLGKYELADQDFYYALSNGTKYRIRIIYYWGLTLGILGKDDSASHYFGLVLKDYPDSVEAKKIRSVPKESIEQPEKRGDENPFGLTLLFGALLDSNVSLTTQENDDVLMLSYLSTIIELQPLPLSLNFSLTTQEYLTENEYDIYYLSAGIEGDFKFSKRDSLIPSCELRHYWITYGNTDYGYSSKIEWLREWGRKWETSIFGCIARNSYSDTDYEVLDGTRIEADMEIWKKFTPSENSIRLGLKFNACHNLTEDNYLSYKSESGTVFVKFDFGEKTLLEIKTGFEERKYEEINPEFGIKQSDNKLTWGVSFLQQTAENSFLDLSYDYLIVNSSIQTYDCNRWRAGASIILIF